MVLLVTRVTAQTDYTTVYSRKTGQPNLFVYSLQPKGFVIVSALDEVLAYSHESEFPSLDSLPENIAYWIDLYNEQTDYLIQHPELSRHESKSQQSVEPLLTSRWAQDCYYNKDCPVDNSGPCQHVPAGCVAVAMAQIMYYHQFPVKGNGSKSYSCPPYGTLSANFGQTTYQWDKMADHLVEYNTAVAQLISHCGISVEMHYSPNGSGAGNRNALNAFRRFFNYSTASLTARSQCSDEEWMAFIRNDLDKGIPVYYAGLSPDEGHAFVCDGYDNNGLFHFNFGWNGIADGYYSLGNPQGYSSNQSIIHDLFPATQIPINSDEHGIIYVTPDGTGDGSSWGNATRELQLAIYKSQMDNCSIWVKEGTYTRPGDDFMLYIYQKCRLYGGFRGGEPYDCNLSLRDFTNHPSVLDGRYTQGVIEVNAYGQDILIDGFTIQNGKASNGGGIDLLSGKVQINNCTFHHNQANNYGGAVYDRCGAAYRCCKFNNNLAKKSGGAIAVFNRRPSFWSCLISNNTAKSGGGCYYESEVNLFNCTIVRNKAQEDFGGIYQNPSFKSVIIRNCILWGNTSQGEHPQIGPDISYSYCAVENDQSTTGSNYNIQSENDGSDPAFYVRFNNPTAMAGSEVQGGDWRLQSNSPCIDRVPDIANQPDTDLDGHPRHRHDKVDLGAYESDVVANTISEFLCDEDPFYYQDSLISALGYYTFLFPGIPYDSLVVVEMLPNPQGPVELFEEICENETYDFLGTNLNESGIYHTVHRCVDYTLHLTVDSISTVQLQKEICSIDTYDFFGTPLTEAGHYSYLKDCTRYELDLKVKPTSTTPVYLEETICDGETYDFYGRPLNTAGHYAAFTDCAFYELDLNVAPLFEMYCSHDTVVHYGYPITLSASGADTYRWSTGDTTASITFIPTIDMVYTVTGLSKYGCKITKNITVKVDMDSDDIALYPNPAHDSFNVYMPLIDEVELLNLFGERIYHTQAEREPVTLDISKIPNGVYIVHTRALFKHFYKTLVVCH